LRRSQSATVQAARPDMSLVEDNMDFFNERGGRPCPSMVDLEGHRDKKHDCHRRNGQFGNCFHPVLLAFGRH
jgi:hypothetical protein